MCIPSSTSTPSACTGHCDTCALGSPLLLEQHPQRRIALTALRVFVLPLLAALLTTALCADDPALQLSLGYAAFLAATALLRLIPGGRLL